MYAPTITAIKPTSGVKDCVFVLLSENPASVAELHRLIKRRFKKSVSYPAVLKATHELERESCVKKEGKSYCISETWVREQRALIEQLYRAHCLSRKERTKTDLGKDVTVYTVPNIYELDRLWDGLLRTWAQNKPEDTRNVWAGRHCWWLLGRLHDEDVLHDDFMRYKVTTYNLLSEDRPLDKMAIEYYQGKKVRSAIVKKITQKDEHIAAFGDTVLRFTFPEPLSREIEEIYTKRTIPLDFKAVATLFRKPIEIEVTVFRDTITANAIKNEITKQIN